MASVQLRYRQESGDCSRHRRRPIAGDCEDGMQEVLPAVLLGQAPS